MPQELLHGIEAHSILYQPAGEGVAQTMEVKPVVSQSECVYVILELVRDPALIRSWSYAEKFFEPGESFQCIRLALAAGRLPTFTAILEVADIVDTIVASEQKELREAGHCITFRLAIPFTVGEKSVNGASQNP